MRQTKFAMVIAGLGLLISIGAVASAKVNSPGKSAVGTWRLDAKRSSFGNMPAPKFEQLVVSTDTADSLQWNMKGMSADGKSYFSSYNGAIDGKDHPMMSNERSGTVAYTRTASGGVSWVMKDKSGAVIETGTGQLSPDGNTLTLKGTVQGPKGKEKFVSVFERTK